MALRGVEVELRYRIGGTVTVHYKDRILPVTACRAYPVLDPAEDDKTIDLRIDAIVAARHTEAAASLVSFGNMKNVRRIRTPATARGRRSGRPACLALLGRPPPTWPHRVSVSLWSEACQVLGREGAALALAIVSTKPDGHFTRGPAGYFRGMVRRAGKGELYRKNPVGAARKKDESAGRT